MYRRILCLRCLVRNIMNESSKKYYRNIISLISILLCILVLLLITCRYIFPVHYESQRFFGLISTSYNYFNWRLFIILTACLIVLVLVLYLARKRKINLPGLKLKTNHLRYILVFLLLISTTFFIFGLIVPFYTTSKLRFWETDVTLISAIRTLFNNGETFLGTVISFFTVLFPILKIAVSFFYLFGKKVSDKMLKVLNLLGKWSMLDVFIVALLLLNMKLESQIIGMKLQPGVIYLSVSILVNMVVYYLLGRKTLIRYL